jgi:predicted component of type VI protein secretion system
VLYLFLLAVIVAVWRGLRTASVRPQREASLEVIDPGRAHLGRGERIGLTDGATVGRSAGNGVRIEEDSISSRHAAFQLERGRWWLEDLGSTNGSFINERRITGRTPLRDGDLVQIGLVTVRFHGR